MNDAKNLNPNIYILSEVMAVCETLCKLNPVVLFGTLLGIVRDGDLIEWNNDIELGVLSSDWNEDEISILCSELRQLGLIITYYRLNRAISIRTRDRAGEVHINYFGKLDGQCCRAIEPSDLRFANIFSFVVYCFANMLSADLDPQDGKKLKFLFLYLNYLIPYKIRKKVSLFLIKTSLWFTTCKGVYVFPFTLNCIEKINFHGFQVNVPSNPEKVVKEIYGAEWSIPKRGWSYYDPKNADETKIKKAKAVWEYANGEPIKKGLSA